MRKIIDSKLRLLHGHVYRMSDDEIIIISVLPGMMDSTKTNRRSIEVTLHKNLDRQPEYVMFNVRLAYIRRRTKSSSV